MSQAGEQNNTTEIQSAIVSHSGSGNIIYKGWFIPTPNLPSNCSNLPNPHPHFVGRQDKIQEVMNAIASRAWIIGIDGMGGIGKTTLALEVAHRCGKASQSDPPIPRFTGYIWLSARDKPDFRLDDVITSLLYVLSPLEHTRRKLPQSEQFNLAVKALVVEPRLLIIDNFESVKDEALYRFLKTFPGPSKVLITSRIHINTGEEVVTLGGLSEKEALELLFFEAARLKVPIEVQDELPLRIIAQKSHGIPLVLRWAMESVRDGQTLESVLNSLDNATAKDIFDSIFKSSLAMLDAETRSIFRSMALLPTWARIETITAMNMPLAAIQSRLSILVKYSLVEDNGKLVQIHRRYQLHPITRSLAKKELASTKDKGKSILNSALLHYLKELNELISTHSYSTYTKQYLEEEYINLESIVQFVAKLDHVPLLEQCILVYDLLGKLDYDKRRSLLPSLSDAINRVGDLDLALKVFRLITNPYSTGLPVRSPMFFGRGELLESIQRTFESELSNEAVISLIGPRRIGKTSILYQLGQISSNKCVYVFIDLQGAYTRDVRRLLFAVAKDVYSVLSTKNEGFVLEVGAPNQEEFREDPVHAFDTFILDITSALGNRCLVLMFDEFESLSNLGPDEVTRILLYLRSKIQQRTFGLITAGAIPPQEIALPGNISTPFNITQIKRVSFLERKDAIELLRQPMYGLLKYESKAIEYLLHASGCHPYLLQLLCNSIVEECYKSQKFVVGTELIETILPLFYEQSSMFFLYIINQLSKSEQVFLLAAAWAIEEGGDCFTAKSVKEMLVKGRVSMIENSLRRLEQQEVLARDLSGNYRFTVELFRNWLIESNAFHNIVSKSLIPVKRRKVKEKEMLNMGTNESDKDKPSVTNTTHIGQVVGQVHTGTGDITVNSFLVDYSISTKEEFLSALRIFKEELNNALQQGLPEETYDDTIVEVEAVEREAQKQTSKPDRIIRRLESAKALITAGTSVATTAISAVDVSSKLVPLIENVIQAVGRIFH